MDTGTKTLTDSPAVVTNQAARIEVYTDGECPLCQWMRAKVEPFDREHRILWMNYRDPEVLSRAEPYTFQELNEEMHARTPDGRWSAGYQAWVEVIRVLPAWRWLAPVLSVWPFTRLGPVFYRWLAARRYKLFGVPPPCDPHGVCTLHKG
jgi:predicted DCC family thiol-disulfide oxidoreductase YuxK